MKAILLSAIALATALPASAAFEGVIHFNQTVGKQTMTSEYAIKDDRVRMEMGSGESHSIMLFDAGNNRLVMLMPAQRMYMTMPVPASATEVQEATLEETGEEEEIAGYECEQFIVKDAKQTFEIWATDELGRYLAFGGPGKNETPAWVRLLAEREMFPLRTITKDRRGKVTSSMEATSVEEKDLDDELFEIPEGYREFKMPNLGDMMGGRGG